MTASLPHQTQYAAGANTTYTRRFSVVSDTVSSQNRVLERDGLRGSRTPRSGDVAAAFQYVPQGTIVIEPSANDILFWLPFILGGSANVASYPLAETVPTFAWLRDEDGAMMQFPTLKVNRATLSGSQTDPVMKLALDVVGGTEASVNSFSNVAATYERPFLFSDLTLNLTSNAARQPFDWQWSVDNQLITDRFLNTLTLTAVPEGERIIQMAMTLPYGDNTALYPWAAAGANGSFNMAIASTNSYLAASFPLLFGPPTTPAVPDRNENRLLLTLRTYANSAANGADGSECVVTASGNA